MTTFETILNSYAYPAKRTNDQVLVCTHATFSSLQLCRALVDRGYRVTFIPVAYSRSDEYLSAMEAIGVAVIDDQKQIITLIGQADCAIEDGARVSKIIAENNITVKAGFFTVEQTSGGIRYLAENMPKYSVIDVALSPLKLDIENRRATPEAVIQQYSEATGHTLGGKRVLVLGFGSIGEGIARLARVLGARVTVYDDSNVKRMFAKHRGYHVLAPSSLESELGTQDVLFMATNRYSGDILNPKRILLLKNGATIVNAGSGRGELAKELHTAGMQIAHDAEMTINEEDGHFVICSKKADQTKTVTVLGSGYPVNLHLGKGTSHDAIQFVMAMLFLAVIEGPIVDKMGIQPLPSHIQEHIAGAYLQAEEAEAFKPTLVKTKEITVSERLYGGVFPFHNQLNNAAHFAVVRAWFKSGSKTRGHYHLRSQEAYYALQGCAEIITWKHDEPNAQKKKHTLATGDYLLVPEGYFHDVVVTSKQDFESLVISSPPFQVWDQFFEEKTDA